MLLCDEKTFYIGISDDLKNRLFQHKNKLNISTKKFSDFDLVYAEKYQSKFEAAKREKQLKGWSHAKKQMLIDGKLGINACTELESYDEDTYSYYIYVPWLKSKVIQASYSIDPHSQSFQEYVPLIERIISTVHFTR